MSVHPVIIKRLLIRYGHNATLCRFTSNNKVGFDKRSHNAIIVLSSATIVDAFLSNTTKLFSVSSAILSCLRIITGTS
ncbi:hypothetical protein CW304_11490 [Bacillus sp. UFRGS-B20]|nr:hypothetical protein CW304_11490 [Bacillus sp. UFRGS-B20]